MKGYIHIPGSRGCRKHRLSDAEPQDSVRILVYRLGGEMKEGNPLLRCQSLYPTLLLCVKKDDGRSYTTCQIYMSSLGVVLPTSGSRRESVSKEIASGDLTR